MKRNSESGSSPPPKQQLFQAESYSSLDADASPSRSSSISSLAPGLDLLLSQSPPSSVDSSVLQLHLSQNLSPRSSASSLPSGLQSFLNQDQSSSSSNPSFSNLCLSQSSHSSEEFLLAASELRELTKISDPDLEDEIDLKTIFPKQSLGALVEAKGVVATAKSILKNEELSKEVIKQYFESSHQKFKQALKTSILSSKKKNKDREYLLNLAPFELCKEFQQSSGDAFDCLVRGCLGFKNVESLFESKQMVNTVSLLYGTMAKAVNHLASGYCLLMATAAKDAGMREDSMKLFPCFVHPRTVQKHMNQVMSKGWDSELVESLKKEKQHYEKLSQAKAFLEDVLVYDPTNERALVAAKAEVEELTDTMPPQLHITFDNLNLSKKPRYERADSSSSSLNYVASMIMKDRINSNHMSHNEGIAVKDVDELHVNDFIPSVKELDYVLVAMIHNFSSKLIRRHPKMFSSIASKIKEYNPHQFFDEMQTKSEEYTGKLYMLSESETEELLIILEDMQNLVHTYEDSSGKVHGYEKKIVSGDQLTEKNSHYAILR